MKTLIAIVYSRKKKYANNIKRALDFYYYSPFLYGNSKFLNMLQMEDLMDIYGVSINRMLISIKKIFRCKIYVSTLIQCLILRLFLISML